MSGAFSRYAIRPMLMMRTAVVASSVTSTAPTSPNVERHHEMSANDEGQPSQVHRKEEPRLRIRPQHRVDAEHRRKIVSVQAMKIGTLATYCR